MRATFPILIGSLLALAATGCHHRVPTFGTESIEVDSIPEVDNSGQIWLRIRSTSSEEQHVYIYLDGQQSAVRKLPAGEERLVLICRAQDCAELLGGREPLTVAFKDARGVPLAANFTYSRVVSDSTWRYRLLMRARNLPS